MAVRKRRTYQEQVQQPVPHAEAPVLEWPTAIYARLSVEKEGDSIENQVEICKAYLEEHPYLHLFDVYMDNGWTGTNTDRPEFQRMLGDIHSGRVKAIVLKDFSRFSRDYIEAGNLLENVFPFLGVRFVSVTDHYDSFETDGTAESLLIPLKNLINSYYAKDISKKIISSIHARQLAGEFLPSKIPYGYLKSKTKAYRLEPDPETEDVVRRIFREYHEGTPISRIVKELNTEEIPSPGHLRYLRGQSSNEHFKTSLWSVEGIKQFLRNPTYTGSLVFGRWPKALYLGITSAYGRERDPSKWRVLPDMHEPLVDQALFDEVQQMLARSRKSCQAAVDSTADLREKYPALLRDYAYCGDCGARMAFSRHMVSNSETRMHCDYKCARYPHKCTGSHAIQHTKLNSIVWNAMRDQLTYFCDYERLASSLTNGQRETAQQADIRKELQSVLTKIRAIQGKRERLYEDFTCGILSPEDYVTLKQRYEGEYQSLNQRLNQLQTQQSKLNRTLSDRNQWLLHMQKMQGAAELTRDLVEALIEKIYVYQTGRERRVEIVFKYQDDFDALQAAYAELEGRDGA